MDWQTVVAKFPEANFLQSPSYGKMHELIGDKVVTRSYGKNGQEGYALMIIKNARRGRYLEVPCGPLIDWQNEPLVKETLAGISQVATEENCVFARIRPQLMASERNTRLLENHGLKKSPMHLAAEHTVIIDLTKTTDELLANMRRQTRYDVKRSSKLGITVGKSNSEEIFKDFHKVQAETARRQNFIPPDLKTLLAEREAFLNNAEIYVAKTPDHEPIAYGLIIKDGKEGDYYEAASTMLNHKLPGAHALLWQAMKDLKEEGYQRFNLWGIAPANQPNHRYAGVTTFKTGFGGEIVEYVHAHDLIISKPKYLKDLVVETVRRKKRHL